jgi:hypothetical protein
MPARGVGVGELEGGISPATDDQGAGRREGEALALVGAGDDEELQGHGDLGLR